MRVCVGFMFQNEQPWLRMHLPAIARAELDGIVAVDGGSTDGGAEFVRSMGGDVFEREFEWNFAAQQNHLIDCAEKLGYDAMIKWDPDELMFPDHLEQMKVLLNCGYKALRFARYGFVIDREHYGPQFYPDIQTRAFVLGVGLRWQGKVHAVLNQSLAAMPWAKDTGPGGLPVILTVPHIHIYHYAGIKPRAERDLHALNNLRIPLGQPPLKKLPPGHKCSPFPFHLPFIGEQPIFPGEWGPKAPLVNGPVEW